MKKTFSGLAAGGRAYFVLEQLSKKRTVLTVVSGQELNLWHNNLKALGQFFGCPPLHVFEQSNHFERINTITGLTDNTGGIVLTTKEALEEKTTLPSELNKQIVRLSLGGDYNHEGLVSSLSGFGYSRVDFVEDKGQFSRRGEILDVWSVDMDIPWRLVFNINNLESIRTFDVATQRSGQFLRKISVLPATELPQAYFTDYIFSTASDASDIIVYCDFKLSDTHPGIEALTNHDWIINDALVSGSNDAGFMSLSRYEGRVQLFIAELKRFTNQGYNTKIFCSHEGEKERLEEILAENKWHAKSPEMLIGPLEQGFYSPLRKLVVFSSQEVLYKRRPVAFPKFKTGRRLEGLWEISSGDYVVHERYGIGRYLGLKKLARGMQEQEYLYLEYKGGDKLYVPVDDFSVVQKYVGLEGHRPKLHSLDTVAWERAKQRAKKSAQDLAEELLKLYAARQKLPGHKYQDDTPWERELVDSFSYSETQDQLKAIQDVSSDLCVPRPMERVICGDVGYGKTEVAIRAAFKVVLGGKQVAVLVPTTVLAEQHFQTFQQRLSPFPVEVKVLSRFEGKKHQKDIIRDIESGATDIIIGTHRLLQKDIKFKDLGLLVIDEEHRFGVKQKEKIKSMKKNVDVLMLSATPIPRTLSLALSSIRDLSVIETPPYGRLPIETYLGSYDANMVKRVICAELSRGGQVFYVHNRVETILSRAEYLRKVTGEARLGVVHGQLPAREIEKTMWRFLHKEIDVLIATTIIESGLDIPSVNTMIIEDAENFGLAQLYQLRGRIGRADKKAYCYLFYSSGSLTEDAQKRLKALKELNELGSGFRLALRDLEIRGGGNILGSQQHGFVRDVGFELYSRLIAQAGSKLKGNDIIDEEAREEPKTVIDFSLPAYIPDDYIEQEDLRIIFYRRMANAKSNKDITNVKDELNDRFGNIPQPLSNLFKVTGLKLLAQENKIKSILEKEKCFEMYFLSGISFSSSKILKLARDYKNILEFIRGESQGVRFKKEFLKKDIFDFFMNFLLSFNKYAEFKGMHSV